MIERMMTGIRYTLLGWLASGCGLGITGARDGEHVLESPLRFAPEAPQPGSSIVASYTPIETLAGERELVLRGHYRTEQDGQYNRGLDNIELARLRPSPNGTFTATFSLPDKVLYTALVVEDNTGQRLDTDGGKLFELLLHGEDGRPLYHSLIQRAYDFAGRNWIAAYESNRLAMELYPDSLAGWSTLRFHEDVALGTMGSDSLLAWHKKNFGAIHEDHMHRDELPPETVAALYRYARSLEDSVTLAYWTERARNEARGTRTWAQLVGIETLLQFYQDADEALTRFEEYWPSAEGTGSQVPSWALQVASAANDLPATDLWIERRLAGGGSMFAAARVLSRIAERRVRALELARQGLDRANRAGWDEADLRSHPDRPLGRTVAEYARTRARQWADRLNTYSGILAAAGEQEEALAALEEAASSTVNPAVFARLAEMKLSRGDTAGAARDYAVLAADPLRTARQVDSLAALVGHDSEGPAWRGLLAAAESRMLPRILRDTVRWNPRSSSVSDEHGNRMFLSDLTDGRTTVIAFWARSCGYAVEEIPELLRLREFLETMGVQLLSVTSDDQPGPDMDEFIAARGITYPVYYDLGAEVQNAFGVSAIPSYFVLDASGSVRFAFTRVSEIPRQLDALADLQEPPAPKRGP